MVFPEGTTIPPIPYLIALTLAVIGVIGGLLRRSPPIHQGTVIAFAPWMAAGGALHVVSEADISPELIAPFLGTPAVYVTTAVLAGLSWLYAVRPTDGQHAGESVTLAIHGVIFTGVIVVVILGTGASRGTLSLFWPILAVVLSIGLTLGIWLVLDRLVSKVTLATGWVGFLVIFAHVLDGISTAVGVDILGASERSPLPLFIMDVAATLPTADLLGVGWAFLLAKIIVAVAVLWLFAPFVREEPRQAFVLLGAIAAVGLGPGVHNLLLFTIGG